MNFDEFWSVIDQTTQTANHDLEQRSILLKSVLLGKSADDVLDFADILFQLRNHVYQNYPSVLDAGYIILEGGGDDGLADFCVWLIAQGRDTFYSTLNDPEWLADYLSLEDRYNSEFESFSQVPGMVYQILTKEELEIQFDRPRVNLNLEIPIRQNGCMGDQTPYEECLEERYPRLSEKFTG